MLNTNTVLEITIFMYFFNSENDLVFWIDIQKLINIKSYRI